MSARFEPPTTPGKDWFPAARDNLWLSFTRHSAFYGDDRRDVPMIVRGEGVHLYDDHGRKLIDGLGGLFTTQIGHGRPELAQAAYDQMMKLDFFPLWGIAHDKAAALAERLASLAPGDLNRVFFASTGSEAVETAWKMLKQYYKVTGRPLKHKVISRYLSYHGTTQGALSITGLPTAKQFFEPLVPSTIKVPNTNFYRAPEHLRDDLAAFGRYCADEIEQAIIMEGPDTIAAVFLEPVQNSGGCFVPPPGYLERVRQICDQYDVALVADETITGFGRIGDWFAMNRFGVQPDIITCAKGITSGYAPLGAVIVHERYFEPFKRGMNAFLHGFTYSGHPVSCAVALKNLEVMEDERLNEHVRENEDKFRKTLEKLLDLPMVGDVRGAGYFYGIELVKDKTTRESFNAQESEKLLRGVISPGLFYSGLYCRADDRGDPVIQLAPPLIADQAVFDEIEQILRSVITRAGEVL